MHRCLRQKLNKCHCYKGKPLDSCSAGVNQAAQNVPVRRNNVFNQRFAQLVQSWVEITEASHLCRINTNGGTSDDCEC